MKALKVLRFIFLGLGIIGIILGGILMYNALHAQGSTGSVIAAAIFGTVFAGLVLLIGIAVLVIAIIFFAIVKAKSKKKIEIKENPVQEQ